MFRVCLFIVRDTPTKSRLASSQISPKDRPGWQFYELDASHSPNITAPTALMKVLTQSLAG